MGEYMTIEEIDSRFDSEWVLLDQPRKNEFSQVIGGILVWHSKDRDEVYEKAGELPVPRNLAFHYTGKIRPEGVEFCLSPFLITSECSPPGKEEGVGEYVTVEELDSRYDSEWVLLDKPSHDEFSRIIGGILVCHSKSRDELSLKAMELPAPRDFAVHYTGKTLPEGVVLVL